MVIITKIELLENENHSGSFLCSWWCCLQLLLFCLLKMNSLLFYSLLPSSFHDVEDVQEEKEERDGKEEEILPNPLPQYKFEVDMKEWEEDMITLTDMNR